VRVIGTMLGVQYSRLPGEAWQLGAGYAVARLPASVDSPFGFFQRADDKDKERANLPLAAILALAAAGVGIIFSLLEYTKPLRVFRTDAIRLAKGEIEQLQPSRFRGVFRKIASDLNDGIDAVLAKGGGPRRGPADLKQVLGDIPDQPQMSAFSFPGENMAEPSSGNSSPSGPPKPLPSAPSNPRLPKAPPRPGAIAAAAQNLDNTMEAERDETNPGRGRPAANGELSDWGSGNSEDTEWRAVYQEFVGVKQQCGESTDGFTFEKFEQTLKKNREALMNRHGAKRVKFSVYIKDGKAALKASPLKD
jgi:hypothetical protein